MFLFRKDSQRIPRDSQSYFLAPIAAKILLFFSLKNKRLQRIAGLATKYF